MAKHYVLSSGITGIPWESVTIHPTREEAIKAAIESFALRDMEIDDLRADGYVEFSDGIGTCSTMLDECCCDDPAQHKPDCAV